MKNTSVWYQLFLERVNSCSAIALSFCLIAAAPAMAQEDTIELKDANPGTNTPVGQPNFNYDDLPPLENQNFPSTAPQEPTAPLPAATPEFATEETDYTLGPGDRINLDIFQVE